jgi:hypothetical protein
MSRPHWLFRPLFYFQGASQTEVWKPRDAFFRRRLHCPEALLCLFERPKLLCKRLTKLARSPETSNLFVTFFWYLFRNYKGVVSLASAKKQIPAKTQVFCGHVVLASPFAMYVD